ncbi:MAG: signal peptide peptidase SppA [Atribacteria sp.]|nr:signal peptide peptidase SppA [Candidatus Atribacteria bacterium]
MRIHLIIILIAGFIIINGCGAPNIKLFTDASAPLQEFTLQGKEKGKVLIIPVRGIISDNTKKGMLYDMPGMVQEIVSQLRMAEKDEEVRAVLLKIDSPGGSTTASDILYHEIMAYKKRTGAKVVAAMMDIATSGGYYVSLPSDLIIAHPTTITGSIGVIFIRPELINIMGKIGLDIEVIKSGQNKDMGSPFRESTEEEHKIFQDLINELGGRFISLVAEHRKIDQNILSNISTARVYLAKEALQLGLVDEIGYLNDAILQSKKLAGLNEDCKVIVYRRTRYPNDNIYNTSTTKFGSQGLSLIDLGILDSVTSLHTGFYYLWPPVARNK